LQFEPFTIEEEGEGEGEREGEREGEGEEVGQVQFGTHVYVLSI